MKPKAILLAVLALCAGTALAQATTSGTTPSGDTAGGASSSQGPATAGPANSAGVIPPVPAVQEPPIPSAGADVAGQPGFFRSSPDAIVVPPFTPATPGVTPMDTPTNATVGASASDTSLRDNLASALSADPALAGARINVLVRDGVVTLSGTAQDRAQAERARALAERMVGSSRVSASISAPG
jgi:hypothetical protein